MPQEQSSPDLMQTATDTQYPIVIQKYKYPIMEDKMKTLLRNRQEALAAHKLARSHISARWKSTFAPFKKGDQVWLDSRNLKTIYHKKMKPNARDPLKSQKSLASVLSHAPPDLSRSEQNWSDLLRVQPVLTRSSQICNPINSDQNLTQDI
jgi:hypothetical protein